MQGGPSFFDEPEQATVPRSDRRLIVEADAVAIPDPPRTEPVRDAQTSVLAAEGLPIGRATNNVAEYRRLDQAIPDGP